MDSFSVEELFHPFSWRDFSNQYFEEKVLLIKRNAPDFFQNLLTIPQVDEVLFSQQVTHPSFRVVDSKTGEFPDPGTYTQNGSTNINPIEFCSYFTKGGTLAMAGMHRHVHSLRKFCNNLHEKIGYPTQTNLYLTPPNSQGFSPHYDTHDVIVLQIDGYKSWKIYESNVELPDKTMPFQKEGFVPGKVEMEFILEPGDLVYIPRGIVHDAFTTEHSSLHITLGILGYTWGQVLIESTLHNTSKEKEFRKYVSSELSKGDYEQQVDRLLHLLRDDLLQRMPLKRFSHQLKQTTPSHNIGHLEKLIRLGNISSENLFIPTMEGVHASKQGKEVVLTGNGKKIVFPEFCELPCSFLANSAESIKIGAIPGELDDQGKLVLVKRLVAEGLGAIV
jgi:ribosomal protein L16 Arg81 hydroxylase